MSQRVSWGPFDQAPTLEARADLVRLLERLLSDRDWPRAEALLAMFGAQGPDLAEVLGAEGLRPPDAHDRLRGWLAGEAALGRSLTPRFRISLLGPPTVVLEGSGEVSWSLRRSFLLFAYLAMAPERAATKDELVDTFWEEADQGEVRRNFHPTLSHLRRSLLKNPSAETVRDLLLFKKGVYRLNPDVGWEVDAGRLEALAREGREARKAGDAEASVAAWKQAWGLYRGPFLEGSYGSWVEETRASLHRSYLGLLGDLGHALAQLDRPLEALDAFRAVLVEDPLEEPVHAAIMRIYAGQGRRDLVRLQYDRLSALLRRELGVEPLPQTTEEFHRLMA